MSATNTAPRQTCARNEVILLGRLGALPTWKRMPSGDALVAWQVIVERARRPGAKRVVDALACVSFRNDVQQEIEAWQVGDVVEVHGSLRRRFWRGAHGPVSRYEVEVVRARRVASAAPPGRDTPSTRREGAED